MQIHSSRSVLLLVLTSTLTTLAGCGSQPKPEAAATTKPMVMATPAPATLPSAEAVVLKFTDKSIKSIQAGTKTVTIRKGVRTYPMTVRAVGSPGEMVMLDGVTTTPKKMSELTEADAKANGSASLDELKTDLVKDFPGITGDDVVTVVAFKLWKA